jgi:hypothetical protein
MEEGVILYFLYLSAGQVSDPKQPPVSAASAATAPAAAPAIPSSDGSPLRRRHPRKGS